MQLELKKTMIEHNNEERSFAAYKSGFKPKNFIEDLRWKYLEITARQSQLESEITILKNQKCSLAGNKFNEEFFISREGLVDLTKIEESKNELKKQIRIKRKVSLAAISVSFGLKAYNHFKEINVKIAFQKIKIDI